VSRELPVSPPVYVQASPSHVTASWRAACRATTFLAGCDSLSGVGPRTDVLVDYPDRTGRDRMPFRAVDAERARYLRVDPAAPEWRADWEDRSMAVVSITGRFGVRSCRRLHVATTACRSWEDDTVARARELFDGFDSF